ncbi:MAG: PD-(D/E)XK nuclease family protein [Limisphaerales bacterium]
MKWSFSEGRLFRKCQRQWYYKAKLANALAKDPLRHEAYLLSKLNSVHAWRGRIVDRVIETVIVPAIQFKNQVTLHKTLQAAETMFNQQLDFALAHKIRELLFKASDHEDGVPAFFAMEYGSPPTKGEIDQARAEVATALTNLFQSQEFQTLRTMMKSAFRLRAQTSISFPYEGGTIRAQPDLICLFGAEPPLIIDWKVHHFGVHDYYQQLVGYAIALTRCGPHKALPEDLRRYPAHALRLFEAQLLTNEARQHPITEDDVHAVEDRIAMELQEMLMAVDGRDTKDLTAKDFPTTNRPGACATCNFRKLCFEKPL